MFSGVVELVPQGAALRNPGLWNATALRYPLLALPDNSTSCGRHRAYWLTPPMFRMSVSRIENVRVSDFPL